MKEDIQTVINSIQIKQEQIRFDLEVLALWAHAEKTTGHTHETIKAFTFRPEFLTVEQRIENSHRAVRRSPSAYCDKNWHNALRLRNGDVVRMPGIKRPIPPSWMPTDVKVEI